MNRFSAVEVALELELIVTKIILIVNVGSTLLMILIKIYIDTVVQNTILKKNMKK